MAEVRIPVELEVDERDTNQLLASLAIVARHLGVALPGRLQEIGPEAIAFEEGTVASSASAARALGPLAKRSGLRLAPISGQRADDLLKLRSALPAVLILKNGQALVLLRVEQAFVSQEDPSPIARRHAARFILVDPVVGEGRPIVLDVLALERGWNGELLLVKREFRTPEHGNQTDAPFGMAWLAREMLQERGTIRDIVIAALALAILSLGPIMFIRLLVDRVLHHNSANTFAVLCVFMAVFVCCEAVLTFLRRIVILYVSARLDGKLSAHAFSKLLRLPLEFFESTPVGNVARDMNEIGRIRGFMTGQLLGTAIDMIGLVIFLPIMVIISPVMTAWVLAICCLIILFLIMVLPRLRRRSQDVFEAEGRKSAFLFETLRGIHTVKTLALQERQRREWDQRVAASIRLRIREGRLAALVQATVLPMERLMTTGAIAFGVWLVLSTDGTVYVGALIGFMLLANRVASPLIQLSYLVQQYDDARMAVSTVSGLLNRPAEEADNRDGLRSPVRGEIEFNNVTFSYLQSPTPALRGVSFVVPSGKVLGIVGRSGSGKTTITRLLQRLHTEYSGQIKIDGTELKEFDVNHLRAGMGVVLQESFLFSGSIRDNIAIGEPGAPLERVIEMARLAGADEFISQLPRGYETQILEGGSNFSGGQRQRLAVARALMRNPGMLLFDEATSALDAESEAVLISNFRRIASGRTVIMISHRLASLSVADSILVIDGGLVIDQGTHDELLERCEMYARLWRQQNRTASRPPEPRALAKDAVPLLARSA